LSHLSIPVCQHKLNCSVISTILQANDSSTPPRAMDEAEQAKIKLEDEAEQAKIKLEP